MSDKEPIESVSALTAGEITAVLGEEKTNDDLLVSIDVFKAEKQYKGQDQFMFKILVGEVVLFAPPKYFKKEEHARRNASRVISRIRNVIA